MEIKPAFATAITGIQRGTAAFDKAASQVASREAMESGPEAGPLVDGVVAQRNVEANVKVAKAADEMLGNLLDELA